eukprot:gnl/Chilomastix_cuspidata/3213.p1 GENE.gnl/Chilomastix_cuspidata/3213~~gnl/Chilomastix_cuspidata/3213.p1  ORF type:complete len:925 (-),score=351.15 gnl/Chilomastix_cuspidata/3213:2225-4999(-)
MFGSNRAKTASATMEEKIRRFEDEKARAEAALKPHPPRTPKAPTPRRPVLKEMTPPEPEIAEPSRQGRALENYEKYQRSWEKNIQRSKKKHGVSSLERADNYRSQREFYDILSASSAEKYKNVSWEGTLRGEENGERFIKIGSVVSNLFVKVSSRKKKPIERILRAAPAAPPDTQATVRTRAGEMALPSHMSTLSKPLQQIALSRLKNVEPSTVAAVNPEPLVVYGTAAPIVTAPPGYVPERNPRPFYFVPTEERNTDHVLQRGPGNYNALRGTMLHPDSRAPHDAAEPGADAADADALAVPRPDESRAYAKDEYLTIEPPFFTFSPFPTPSVQHLIVANVSDTTLEFQLEVRNGPVAHADAPLPFTVALGKKQARLERGEEIVIPVVVKSVLARAHGCFTFDINLLLSRDASLSAAPSVHIASIACLVVGQGAFAPELSFTKALRSIPVTAFCRGLARQILANVPPRPGPTSVAPLRPSRDATSAPFYFFRVQNCLRIPPIVYATFVGVQGILAFPHQVHPLAMRAFQLVSAAACPSWGFSLKKLFGACIERWGLGPRAVWHQLLSKAALLCAFAQPCTDPRFGQALPSGRRSTWPLDDDQRVLVAPGKAGKEAIVAVAGPSAVGRSDLLQPPCVGAHDGDAATPDPKVALRNAPSPSDIHIIKGMTNIVRVPQAHPRTEHVPYGAPATTHQVRMSVALRESQNLETILFSSRCEEIVRFHRDALAAWAGFPALDGLLEDDSELDDLEELPEPEEPRPEPALPFLSHLPYSPVPALVLHGRAFPVAAKPLSDPAAFAAIEKPRKKPRAPTAKSRGGTKAKARDAATARRVEESASFEEARKVDFDPFTVGATARYDVWKKIVSSYVSRLSVWLDAADSYLETEKELGELEQRVVQEDIGLMDTDGDDDSVAGSRATGSSRGSP